LAACSGLSSEGMAPPWPGGNEGAGTAVRVISPPPHLGAAPCVGLPWRRRGGVGVICLWAPARACARAYTASAQPRLASGAVGTRTGGSGLIAASSPRRSHVDGPPHADRRDAAVHGPVARLVLALGVDRHEALGAGPLDDAPDLARVAVARHVELVPFPRGPD